MTEHPYNFIELTAMWLVTVGSSHIGWLLKTCCSSALTPKHYHLWRMSLFRLLAMGIILQSVQKFFFRVQDNEEGAPRFSQISGDMFFSLNEIARKIPKSSLHLLLPPPRPMVPLTRGDNKSTKSGARLCMRGAGQETIHCARRR